MSSGGDLPVISFEAEREWETWLAENHTTSNGIWMCIFKKAANATSITYAEALDVALCYGWIDGWKKRYDERSWLQKFTPRGPRGIWSKVNTENVQRLTEAGRMKPAGLAQVEAAKRDGRWDAAYDPASRAQVPDDFLRELDKEPKAKAFFETLNKRNTFPIAYRLHSAKRPATSERRMREILKMLARGEKFYP